MNRSEVLGRQNILNSTINCLLQNFTTSWEISLGYIAWWLAALWLMNHDDTCWRQSVPNTLFVWEVNSWGQSSQKNFLLLCWSMLTSVFQSWQLFPTLGAKSDPVQPLTACCLVINTCLCLPLKLLWIAIKSRFEQEMSGKVQTPKIFFFFSPGRGYSNFSFSDHMNVHMESSNLNDD